MKHLLPLLLVFLLLCAGCGKKTLPEPVFTPTPGTSTPSSSTDAPQAAPDGSYSSLPLFGEDDATLFSIVLPADADDDLSAAADTLKQAILHRCGADLAILDDTAEPADCELLLGQTTRPASASALDAAQELTADYPGRSMPLLDYGGYLVRAEGKRIAFVASDAEEMNRAITDFCESWLKTMRIEIPEGGVSLGMRAAVEVKTLDSSTRPALITTLHETDAPVIADVVATDPDFGADPTGKRDSTSAIKKALTVCANAGGGTVWLPAGQYLVTSSIEIPAYVSLLGERPLDDPKTLADYGTIIVAKPKTGQSPAASLFVLRGSCGVVGMTVWYPEQSIENPVKYPYIFYVTGNGQGGYMLQTVKDVLVVNGWTGIGACVVENNAHEQTTIENFRGTFLNHAVASYNEADVGTFKSIRIPPDYWANSPFDGSPDVETIRAYTRANATGLILGDLEWDQFSNIEIEDCLIGMQTVDGIRATFTGEMVDMTVRRCGDGLITDDMDARWGMNLARSVFEDCERPITNNTRAFLKMTDVTVTPETELHGTLREADGDLAGYTFDYTRTQPKVAPYAYTASLKAGNAADVSRDLQEALDTAGLTGGVLYLPAGVYRLDHPVTVPSGVELRGSSSVGTRGQTNWSKGTLISCYYGIGDPEDSEALLTLSANSGVSGIRFVCPTNGPSVAATTPYLIRGTGADVWCVNVAIAAAGSGVDFAGCDRHFIKKVTACCYDHGIRAGGRDGYIEGCLQNATVMMRQGLGFLEKWIPESEVFNVLFPILRTRSVFLTLDGAEGERVLDYFAYGVMTVLEVRDSRDVLVMNLGGDNIGTHDPLIRVKASELAVINAQRYNGILFEADDASDFSLYNPLTVDNKREPNILHGEEHEFRALGE
ncbi:MAG: hypothetical protein J6Q17_06240 [Clostridia bacterium]|nr:hypothetical protein [Clostridia bacterium]